MNNPNWPSDLGGAVAMIVIGAVLLMDRLDVMSFQDVFRLWPLVLIAIGVRMLISGADAATPEGDRR